MQCRAGAPKASVFIRSLDGCTREGREQDEIQMVSVQGSDWVVEGHCASDAVVMRAGVRVDALVEPAANF